MTFLQVYLYILRNYYTMLISIFVQVYLYILRNHYTMLISIFVCLLPFLCFTLVLLVYSHISALTLLPDTLYADVNLVIFQHSSLNFTTRFMQAFSFISYDIWFHISCWRVYKSMSQNIYIIPYRHCIHICYRCYCLHHDYILHVIYCRAMALAGNVNCYL